MTRAQAVPSGGTPRSTMLAMLLRLRPDAAMGIDDPFYPGGPFASRMLPRLYAPRGGA